MQAHGRFEQEAWTYDAETLAALPRATSCCTSGSCPYVRAAAATAARCGLPIVRPLLLDRPGRRARLDDRRRVRLRAGAVGRAGARGGRARRARSPLPRGDWIDFWTGERARGGGELRRAAPRSSAIPVWVRAGSIVVTYPAEHVAGGLGDTPERERPLEATLWGEPPLGRAGARLADGTRVRWRDGRWTVTPERDVTFAVA